MESSRPPLRRLAAATAATCLLLSWATVTAASAADQPHWEFQLTVEAPVAVKDPFLIGVTGTLVGLPVGVVLPPVSATYNVVAVAPNGQKRLLGDHATASGNITGAASYVNLRYWPLQNGEWTFQVWQLDGGRETLAIEHRVSTDKAPPPSVSSDSQFVSAVRTDPAAPIVGQPATILVEMANQPAAAAIRDVPIDLIDDDGVQQLGTVMSPGAGRTASLVWVPQRATDHGLLQAVDLTVPVVVLDVPIAATATNDDTTDTVPPPDDTAPAADR